MAEKHTHRNKTMTHSPQQHCCRMSLFVHAAIYPSPSATQVLESLPVAAPGSVRGPPIQQVDPHPGDSTLPLMLGWGDNQATAPSSSYFTDVSANKDLAVAIHRIWMRHSTSCTITMQRRERAQIPTQPILLKRTHTQLPRKKPKSKTTQMGFGCRRNTNPTTAR